MENNKIAFYYKNSKEFIVLYSIKTDSENNILIGSFYPIDLNKIKDKKVEVIKYNETQKVKFTNELYMFDMKHIVMFTDYSENAFDKFSKCEGCRYGYANQLGHMDEGGCLQN
jgi:hypothetical protein